MIIDTIDRMGYETEPLQMRCCGVKCAGITEMGGVIYSVSSVYENEIITDNHIFIGKAG